ncbi:HtaA domain-containing protein [Microbacterium sp.]|uniref:HtaA domain-containing protein n=1 Tax=Microbacterium sp. TaxID=51671 RepID=UPI003A8EFFEB
MTIEGYIEWAIRDTFLTYLDAVHASIELSSGAERSERGTVDFPVSHRSADRIEASGSFRATAHGGALDLEITEPVILRQASHWVLGWTGSDGCQPRARLLGITPAALPEDYTFEDVALTSDGASQFGGNYRPWSRMAPIRLTPLPRG